MDAWALIPIYLGPNLDALFKNKYKLAEVKAYGGDTYLSPLSFTCHSDDKTLPLGVSYYFNFYIVFSSRVASYSVTVSPCFKFGLFCKHIKIIDKI